MTTNSHKTVTPNGAETNSLQLKKCSTIEECIKITTETREEISQTSTTAALSLRSSGFDDVSVSSVSEVELLFALAAFIGVTQGICKCSIMRSMFFSIDLRQSLSGSACTLETRLLGEVSFPERCFRGAFLTRASSVSISNLVGLLSSSSACHEEQNRDWSENVPTKARNAESEQRKHLSLKNHQGSSNVFLIAPG